jgi:hypothetical protein
MPYSDWAQNARASSIPSATAALTCGSRRATVKMSNVASQTWRLVVNESMTAVQNRSKRSSVVSPW